MFNFSSLNVFHQNRINLSHDNISLFLAPSLMDIFCRFYVNKTVIIKTMHPTTEFYIFISFNFHSNWTFIAPNLPFQKEL